MLEKIAEVPKNVKAEYCVQDEFIVNLHGDGRTLKLSLHSLKKLQQDFEDDTSLTIEKIKLPKMTFVVNILKAGETARNFCDFGVKITDSLGIEFSFANSIDNEKVLAMKKEFLRGQQEKVEVRK